ncbi:MAG: hypothetical protein QXL67_01245, partial [Candidatus Bathyarchaeia archaeon]
LKHLGGSGSVEQISRTQNLAHAAVMRATLTLKEKGLIRIRERELSTINLTEEGRRYVKDRLPERRLLTALIRSREKPTIDMLMEENILDKITFPIALGWLIRKGWAELKGREIHLKVTEEPPEGDDENLLRLLYEEKILIYEDLNEGLRKVVPELRRRRLIRVESKTVRNLELTDEGWSLVNRGLEVSMEVTRLRPELIATGKWRDYKFLEYDVKASVPDVWGGKKHPYLKFLDEMR